MSWAYRDNCGKVNSLFAGISTSDWLGCWKCLRTCVSNGIPYSTKTKSSAVSNRIVAAEANHATQNKLRLV
jgi:hypothetical protein